MRAHFLIVWGVLLAVGCGVSSPAFAQSALERLERQIRQRTGAPENGPSNAARPVPPPPAAGQPGAVPRDGNDRAGSAHLGVVADDQKDRGRGVRILDVHRGSPADKAGLRKQDLITGVAGVRVRQMTDLSDILDTFVPGQIVEFDLLRGGAPQKARVLLGERQGAGPPAIPRETIPLPPGEAIPRPPEPEPQAGPSLSPPPSNLAPSPPPSNVAPPAEASRVEQLERRVEELERRVAELERQLAQARKKGREL